MNASFLRLRLRLRVLHSRSLASMQRPCTQLHSHHAKKKNNRFTSRKLERLVNSMYILLEALPGFVVFHTFRKKSSTILRDAASLNLCNP